MVKNPSNKPSLEDDDDDTPVAPKKAAPAPKPAAKPADDDDDAPAPKKAAAKPAAKPADDGDDDVPAKAKPKAKPAAKKPAAPAEESALEKAKKSVQTKLGKLGMEISLDGEGASAKNIMSAVVDAMVATVYKTKKSLIVKGFKEGVKLNLRFREEGERTTRNPRNGNTVNMPAREVCAPAQINLSQIWDGWKTTEVAKKGKK